MTQAVAEPEIVIVGAGFSGLGTAVALKQRGIEDFVVLERGDDVGGVWRSSTYPGCRCDVPSHLYSFSFAPNPGWSQTYSPQAEIRDYLSSCADRYELRRHIRFNTELLGATWDEASRHWEIETSNGPLRTPIVISAMGPLTEPKLPDVPGLEDFRGKVMHSARWEHDYELAGKRVASIGTGASAIQYLPEIQKVVERLYVFQRTPPWVMPHGVRAISDRERALFRRLPLAQKLIRGAVYAGRELLVLGFAKDPRLVRLLEKVATSHRETQISDPELRAKVRPSYALGCKRILPSNNWYPTLTKPNVELITGGLRSVTADAVVDEHGVERHVDAIILGTGFHVADPPVAELVRGRAGRLLSDVWAGRPKAYLGTSVPGFPNLFLLLGPNTGLGHSSMVYMIESQIAHVVAAVATMTERRAQTIEVRGHVYERYNEQLDERLAGTVWDRGCSTFYFDSSGRNAVLWPDWTWRFRRRAAHFDDRAYAVASHRPTGTPA
jgi:cation diffusion facilitator CzcD-associated flavoprotein CzcO